jgi:hypothetical protein
MACYRRPGGGRSGLFQFSGGVDAQLRAIRSGNFSGP